MEGVVLLPVMLVEDCRGVNKGLREGDVQVLDDVLCSACRVSCAASSSVLSCSARSSASRIDIEAEIVFWETQIGMLAPEPGDVNRTLYETKIAIFGDAATSQPPKSASHPDRPGTLKEPPPSLRRASFPGVRQPCLTLVTNPPSLLPSSW